MIIRGTAQNLVIRNMVYDPSPGVLDWVAMTQPARGTESASFQEELLTEIRRLVVHLSEMTGMEVQDADTAK